MPDLVLLAHVFYRGKSSIQTDHSLLLLTDTETGRVKDTFILASHAREQSVDFAQHLMRIGDRFWWINDREDLWALDRQGIHTLMHDFSSEPYRPVSSMLYNQGANRIYAGVRGPMSGSNETAFFVITTAGNIEATTLADIRPVPGDGPTSNQGPTKIDYWNGFVFATTGQRRCWKINLSTGAVTMLLNQSSPAYPEWDLRLGRPLVEDLGASGVVNMVAQIHHGTFQQGAWGPPYSIDPTETRLIRVDTNGTPLSNGVLTDPTGMAYVFVDTEREWFANNRILFTSLDAAINPSSKELALRSLDVTTLAITTHSDELVIEADLARQYRYLESPFFSFEASLWDVGSKVFTSEFPRSEWGVGVRMR